jgi:hypothetical protein
MMNFRCAQAFLILLAGKIYALTSTDVPAGRFATYGGFPGYVTSSITDERYYLQEFNIVRDLSASNTAISGVKLTFADNFELASDIVKVYGDITYPNYSEYKEIQANVPITKVHVCADTIDDWVCDVIFHFKDGS